jgi:3-isopropylmalate/(R)-2-methylmalate dehydratase small subunit
MDALMARIEDDPALTVEVDLDAREVRCGGHSYPLTFQESYRQSLIGGTWDSTSVLLANKEEIAATARRLPYTSNFSA